ncbi:MAG: hypothetical protein WA908_05650 [Pontixanthobacter sp.]
MFDWLPNVIATVMTVSSGSVDEPRPIVPAPLGSVCRQADGRIRLGCLPEGTVRALPIAMPVSSVANGASAEGHHTADTKELADISGN